MLHRLANSVLIINTNVADSGHIRADIDKHQEAKVIEQRFLHPEGENGDTIHSAFDHAPDRHFHSFWIMHG